MANINCDIKREYDNDHTQKCRTCLSVDRKLTSLGRLSVFYVKLLIPEEFIDNNVSAYESTLICWECRAMLNRMEKFQRQIQNAEIALTFIQEHGVEVIEKSLSNLTTTILTEEKHEIMLFDNDFGLPPVATKSETLFNLDTYNDDYDDRLHIDEDTTNFVIQQDTEPQTIIKTESTSAVLKTEPTEPAKTSKNNNRWRLKRAMLNKKPKFKIVSIVSEDIKNGCNYKKVPIDSTELVSLLDRERESEFFKGKQYKCEKCILGFNNSKSFVRHKDTHHKKDIGKYICDICKTRLPKLGNLKTHCRNHYYKYVCSLCGYSCYKRYNQYYHMQYNHQRMYRCVKCGLNFWSRKEFYSHYKEWHEKFICDYCGVTFKMKYCIKQHIRKQHSQLECKACAKKFSRYNSLWLHNKLKHPAAAPARAYCVECNKHFDNVYSYKWHLNNSVRHKPKKKVSIPCAGCDKVFSKNIYMKDHYDLVHLKKVKYRCDGCDKNFIRNADLVKHTRRVHEGIQPPRNKMCYVCGKGFSSNKILNNHIRTHTGERPYHCAHCPARFAQKVAMTNHVKNIHLKGRSSGARDGTLGYY